jgi:serine phosphatase RsbU (regulator of sigma subunit)/anti-sigma regulatory factor (Ser/Thr protein kinase)
MTVHATATSRASGWRQDRLGARAGEGRRGIGAFGARVDRVIVLALLLDTAIAVVDAVTPVVLINLVVFGPLVAAVRSTARRTALVAAYALGLAVYEGVPHGIFGTPDHLVRCAAIAVTGALAVWGARLRERREATRRRAALLAEAGALLSASLGYEATLRTVARLVVPGLADWCTVDVPGPGGAIRNVATAHVDPDRVQMAEDLRRRHPPTAEQRAGVARVLRGGPAELYTTIPDELLAATARDPDHLALLRAVGMTSAMVVPMAARGRTLGAITFVAAESGRRYDGEALELAQELARRCAVAVDNARLYGERSRVARTLQQSLLPTRLPEVPGLEVAARFHAVGEDVEVGGDFFDLFAAAGGAWGAVIGDVSGKGAEAAAVTALARYTLRAVAAHDGRPAAVLGALNDAMLGSEHAPERFCTAAYARVLAEAGGPRVEIASGGHPLPLLVRPDGTVEPVGEPGMLLGVSRRPPLTQCEVKLEPGDKLVFYTDGVIEARCPDGGMLGVEALAELLESCGDLDTVATGERIHRAVIDACGDPRDDIAILVLRAAQAGRPRGNEGLVRSGAVGQRRALNLRLRGGPGAPSAARAALDGLGERSLDPGAAHDARLLVSELITNSVRHAGATVADAIGVDAELSPDGLRVQVADDGPGFSPAPALPPPEQTFGRGLFLVDHLADRWGTDDEGRRIWFELDRRPEQAADDGASGGPPLRASGGRWRAFA